MSNVQSRLLSVFGQALDLPHPERRREFLDQACAGDSELRRRADALLEAHENAGRFLEPGEPGDETVSVDMEAGPGAIVYAAKREELPGTLLAGRYVLVEALGEGGMGNVYLARQTEPVRREVAVKVIKAGMDSRAVLARFEAERQALALMDHPHISRVLDAGATPSGRPFFVMELVRGQPITRYCDDRQLPLRDRLRLFVLVCDAIQHAHRKGIIHRDIKPSNVLVTGEEGAPAPKVIDFGLAKATAGVLGEASPATGFGMIVGTPEYMSPEQANFQNPDVDTRSDVYSLGVLLYELLTGATPFGRRLRGNAGILESLQIVRDEEAIPPSDRLASSENLAEIARARGSDPVKITRLVRGELDWIVMKALNKERDGRYESPLSLAREINRFLNDEPVQASPPSVSYRMRKFVRRHKPAVISAALVFVAAFAGVSGSMTGLVKARQSARAAEQSERAAVEERNHAIEAAQAEKIASEKVRQRSRQLEQLNHTLESIFRDLDIRQIRRGPDPIEAVLAKRLVVVADQLNGESLGDPLVVAQLQEILGETLVGLGYSRDAVSLLGKPLRTRQEILGHRHVLTLQTMNNLGAAHLSAGNTREALPILQETLRLRTEVLGEEDRQTLVTRANLANLLVVTGNHSKAVPLFEEILRVQQKQSGEDHPDTLVTKNSLGNSLRLLSRTTEAVRILRETVRLSLVRLGEEQPDTLSCMNNLAMALMDQGALPEAGELLQRVLASSLRRLGPAHPGTLWARNNLAAFRRSAGNLEQAIRLFEENLPLMRQKFGPQDPATMTCMNNLALCYVNLGRPRQAVPLLREALESHQKILGEDHPNTLATLGNTAQALQDSGNLREALPMWRRAYDRSAAMFGPDHPASITALFNLAQALRLTGESEKSFAMSEEAICLANARFGPSHATTSAMTHNLAQAHQSTGRNDRAIPLFEEALQNRKSSLGREHPSTLRSAIQLAAAYHATDRKEEAMTLLEDTASHAGPSGLFEMVGPELYKMYRLRGKAGEAARLRVQLAQIVRTRYAKDSASQGEALATLGKLFLRLQEFENAEPLLRESLAIREKNNPQEWGTFYAKSLLGMALQGRKKMAEAETLLLAGYQGLTDRRKTIPADIASPLAEVLDRLIDLHLSMNKPDMVEKWRTERKSVSAVMEMSSQPG